MTYFFIKLGSNKSAPKEYTTLTIRISFIKTLFHTVSVFLGYYRMAVLTFVLFIYIVIDLGHGWFKKWKLEDDFKSTSTVFFL
jgi:hypothetical protein